MIGRRSWFAVWILACSASCKSASPSEEWRAEARKISDEYQTALKGELMAAMKEGGPKKAIEVCSLKAPSIGARVVRERAAGGWSVKRTSLRLRNAKNRADRRETVGLSELERRLATGESPQEVDWVAREGGNFVYMKPIMMGEICSTCHGLPESIPADVKQELARLYPLDQATGFSPGSLRGAFVVTGPDHPFP